MRSPFSSLCILLTSKTKRNFLWMIFGNGVYALCQWGILIVLTKLGDPEVVGQFALGLAITAPVVMVTNMQLRGAQATDANRKYFFSDYIAVRLLSTIVACSIVIVIVLVGSFEAAMLWVIILMILAKCIESLSDVFYGFFQQQEKMRYIATSQIIKGALSVIVVGIVFYEVADLTVSLIGLCCAWGAVFVVHDVTIARKLLLSVEGKSRISLILTIKESFNDRLVQLINMIKVTFPLGIVMGIMSLNSNIPRYAIEILLGLKALGIFAALAYTTVVINMFALALGQSVMPRLAQYFANDNFGAFIRLTLKVILFNLCIGMVFVGALTFFGREILVLLFSEDYEKYYLLFISLMMAASLVGITSLLGCAMTAARQFDPQVLLAILVVVSTTSLSYVAIPRFGLHGAVLALGSSCILQISGSCLILHRALKVKQRLLLTR
jgi:O-antigen/teichoic acid export membrane protein